ncbi:hypothetical protein VF14_18225 [Nostoc linckia z18]|uniref:Uncharacterized protein n=2 Tax=Nostoc linckia TaxID=92942 RepID=A0A9Q5Z592_NOSLI|nr:hypothetical protein VF04_37605 [Nostoc linckia z7]PHJ81989.1 hypothetical protein VF07_29305 [Nostoc linckia z6]PHJ94026.1 hypothetical protein VF08_34415 [Nostoc linckia z8]PHK33063.1 hypothetical protein VF14_18225 [Nostoc linckia z18]
MHQGFQALAVIGAAVPTVHFFGDLLIGHARAVSDDLLQHGEVKPVAFRRGGEIRRRRRQHQLTLRFREFALLLRFLGLLVLKVDKIFHSHKKILPVVSGRVNGCFG